MSTVQALIRLHREFNNSMRAIDEESNERSKQIDEWRRSGMKEKEIIKRMIPGLSSYGRSEL